MTITPDPAYDAHYHSHSAISWSAILGGAVAALAASLALLVLGAGLGLVTTSPWQNFNDAAADFTIKAAIWLIFMQWVSSVLGGYLTGRLRTKWRDVPADEIHFRDSAHGFLAWALATVLTASCFTTTVTALVAGTDNAPLSITAEQSGNTPNATVQATNTATGETEAATVNTEEAKEDAAKLSTLLFLSFLVGAFAASLSATYGGKHRDEF